MEIDSLFIDSFTVFCIFQEMDGQFKNLISTFLWPDIGKLYFEVKHQVNIKTTLSLKSEESIMCKISWKLVFRISS